MVKVSGTTITMTRGDTLVVEVGILNPDGTPYVPEQSDVVRFALKKDYSDETPILRKVLDNSDLKLTIQPSDTKELDFGNYVYDVELTKADGSVDTFICKARLVLSEEVD